MHRRQFLLSAVGFMAFLTSCKRSLVSSCESSVAVVLDQFKHLADPVLGKAAAQQNIPGMGEEPSKWQAFCEQDLVEEYRRRAAQDFNMGKIYQLDGWFVSGTEAAIDRAVFIAAENSNMNPSGELKP